MATDSSDAAYLVDMLSAAREAQSYVAGMSLDEFNGDSRTRSAVQHQLMVIGAAAGHVSASVRLAHPEIPWSSIVGQRNVIVHGYQEIDFDRIWRVAIDDVPELIAGLEALVSLEP